MGLHDNQFVSPPSVRFLAFSENVHKLLNHMVYDPILNANACQYYLTTGMCNSLFLMDEGLLSIISAGCGQLVKRCITIEPHGIFGTNFAYL